MSATAIVEGRPHTQPIHVLANGGVVVVVGGRDTNVTPEQRADPRLVYWDTNGDGKDAEERILPANCRGVVMTRFTSHRISNWILAQTRKRAGVTLFHATGTGHLKTILDQIIAGAPRFTPAPVPPPPAAPTPSNTINLIERLAESLPPGKRQLAPRGSIQALVKAHYDPSQPITSERTRLVALAREQGVITTSGSVDQTIRKLRRERGLSGTPPCLEAPASEGETVLRTFDDAIAGLQLAREAFAKGMASIVNHQKMIDAMRDTLAGMTQ